MKHLILLHVPCSEPYTRLVVVISYLVHAGPGLVEQSSGLNVFWDQLASHSWNLRPAVQDLQRQVLVGFLWLVLNMCHLIVIINNVTHTTK